MNGLSGLLFNLYFRKVFICIFGTVSINMDFGFKYLDSPSQMFKYAPLAYDVIDWKLKSFCFI